MVKKIDRKINIGIIVASLSVVMVFTMYKIIKTNRDKLYLVTEKRIVEAFIKCKRDRICINNSETLKFLEDNKYLEGEIDPITKEYYNLNSYVIYKEGKYEFIIVE